MNISATIAKLLRHENKWYGKYRAFVCDREQTVLIKDKVAEKSGGREYYGVMDLKREGHIVCELFDSRIVKGPFVAAPCLPPGYFFLPQEGDRILIEFMGGDLERPIWTGMYWNYPPLAKGSVGDLPGENVRQTIIEDMYDPEYFTPAKRIIWSYRGHYICFDDSYDVLSVVHSGGSSVVFDADGGITIDAKEKVTVNAVDTVAITGGKITLNTEVTGANKVCNIPFCLFTGASHSTAQEVYT